MQKKIINVCLRTKFVLRLKKSKLRYYFENFAVEIKNASHKISIYANGMISILC